MKSTASEPGLSVFSVMFLRIQQASTILSQLVQRKNSFQELKKTHEHK